MWAGRAALYGLILFTGWLVYGLIQAERLLPRAAVAAAATLLDQIAGHFSLYAWMVVSWCLIAGVVLAWRAIVDPGRAWMGRRLATTGGAVLLSAGAFLVVGAINIAQVRADTFYKQAQRFENAGMWAASAELYGRALAVRPREDHYMLHLGRSLLQTATAAPQEGAQALPAALSLQDALSLSADGIGRLGQDDLLRMSEFVLQRAQELNPLNTDHTANLARLYGQRSKLTGDPQVRAQTLERSAQYYEAALKLSPNAAHLWNEKGAVLAYMGRHDEAEAAFRHSLLLDDRFADTYIGLAELYGKMGETEKGAEILQRGLEMRPDSLPLLSHLGVAQAHAGDAEGALATNLRLIEEDRNNISILRNLLILYRELGRSEEAVQWADRAVDLLEGGHDGPGADIPLYNLLVKLYIENGKLLKSIELLHGMIDLAPEDYRHPFRLAQVHSELGNFAQARQFGENALTLAPDEKRPDIQAFVDALE